MSIGQSGRCLAILVGTLLRGGTADHVLVAGPLFDGVQYLHDAPVGFYRVNERGYAITSDYLYYGTFAYKIQ